MSQISESLTELRLNKGLSQLQLAKLTGLKQQSISRWEKGDNLTNILDCIKLADFYEISLDELVNRNKI